MSHPWTHVAALKSITHVADRVNFHHIATSRAPREPVGCAFIENSLGSLPPMDSPHAPEAIKTPATFDRVLASIVELPMAFAEVAVDSPAKALSTQIKALTQETEDQTAAIKAVSASVQMQTEATRVLAWQIDMM